MTDSELAMLRAVIAARRLIKKDLAKKCDVTQSQFSLMLHGDMPMPESVRRKVLSELGIYDVWGKMREAIPGALLDSATV